MKRKIIDLPVDVMQKLSIMAAAQGRSLKNLIESILITKANSVSVEVVENPSPSNDPWFDNPENLESVKRGIEDIKAGRCRACSMDEIRDTLGL